jgi:hypothetical protein
LLRCEISTELMSAGVTTGKAQTKQKIPVHPASRHVDGIQKAASIG